MIHVNYEFFCNILNLIAQIFTDIKRMFFMPIKYQLEFKTGEYDKRNQNPNSQKEMKKVKEENRVTVPVTLS